MRQIIGFIAAASILTFESALALQPMQLEDATVQASVPELTVPDGHTVVVSFENDEFIQLIWVDDPGILGITTDRPLCRADVDSATCGYATLLRLRQLESTLPLPGSHFATDAGRSTLVSVATTDSAGANQAVYQFQVTLTADPSASSSLVSIVSPQPPSTGIGALYDIEQIRTGRTLALSQGLADIESSEWQAFEAFMALVDEDAPLAQAILESNVSPRLLQALQELGEA